MEQPQQLLQKRKLENQDHKPTFGEHFAGIEKCSMSGCEKKAFFTLPEENQLLCNHHAKNRVGVIFLPKLSVADTKRLKQKMLEEEESMIETARAANVESKTPGDVIITSPSADIKHGFVGISLSSKKSSKLDASALSPGSLGPVVIADRFHSMNLHNFIIASTLFDNEFDKQTRKPTHLYFGRKLQIEKTDGLFKSEKNRNIVGYVDPENEDVVFNEIQFRVYLSLLYESLVKSKHEFLDIRNLVKTGYNVQLCGPGSRDIKLTDKTQSWAARMRQEFVNTSKPFTCELILFCLISLETEECPWNSLLKSSKKSSL